MSEFETQLRTVLAQGCSIHFVETTAQIIRPDNGPLTDEVKQFVATLMTTGWNIEQHLKTPSADVTQTVPVNPVDQAIQLQKPLDLDFLPIVAETNEIDWENLPILSRVRTLPGNKLGGLLMNISEKSLRDSGVSDDFLQEFKMQKKLVARYRRSTGHGS
jgi:hypothetical protein